MKKTFPHEEGVIVKYAPRFGPAETYINTGLEFEYYMQQIYEQTGDEGFNVYPEG
ncbi:MAG: hypothetical protein IJW21_02145 [Clostridia bacterium]|nr:hypothetical protein [Clostridia bacterium]